MNRCQLQRALFALAVLVFILAAATLPPPAAAQLTVIREAPKGVVLARMTVVTPPAIRIDDREDRLSPGVRIHDRRNMLVLSGALVGANVPVVYKRDVAGLVHEVWLLNEDEYKKLGGVRSTDTPDGLKKFVETLAAVWAARQ